MELSRPDARSQMKTKNGSRNLSRRGILGRLAEFTTNVFHRKALGLRIILAVSATRKAIVFPQQPQKMWTLL